MRQLRVSVVGAGGLGQLHMRSLRSIPGARLVRVHDRSLAPEAKALAVELGADECDLHGALDPGAVDAVVVATPTDTHAPVVLAALDAGLSVFCEKPLARTAAEAGELARRAAARGSKVAVGHVVRYFPEYAAARQAHLDGILGPVAAARLARLNAPPASHHRWYADFTRSGGALLDMAIHDIDWCLWAFGPVARVHAKRAGSGGGEVVAITLRHASDVISYIDASWRNESFSTSLELVGSEGLLRTSGSAGAGFVLALRDGDVAGYMPEAAEELDDPFRLELAAALEWFRGGRPPRATVEDGYAALLTVEAAERSITLGRPVVSESVPTAYAAAR
ncbi:putative dehydrogenase [Motilibacter rhizosphaerae]|uniref:Putative dehydrogenase n=1 Tax=Motilibacter rhizosphaerae TaxID=598652 RepID=A0A4Q7NWV9_9ACTN|nr:Gfo/Idh/MocA family oxidoreductase [Motilibacter rhizosphaerae]RZS91725.1 putative dehydrogenase [Motilibacter rhizosphaerae]